MKLYVYWYLHNAATQENLKGIREDLEKLQALKLKLDCEAI